MGVRRIKMLFADRRAATAVEYGLILAMIVIAMVVALQMLANQTIGVWNSVSNKVVTAG